MAGITNSSGAGYEDAWLIKTDASGNTLWDKTYGASLDDETYYLLQTQDGGYALAGSTLCYGAGLQDAWLLKVSGDTQHSASAVTFNPSPLGPLSIGSLAVAALSMTVFIKKRTL